MKKVILWIVVMIMTLSISIAYADIDLSGMSFDELVALKEKINLALWNSEEWQEVSVPAGIWKIGVDIPEGYWTITPKGDAHEIYYYVDTLDETGTKAGWYNAGWQDILSTRKNKDGSWKYDDKPHEISIDMKSGMYLILPCETIFTPYTGKPDLGFK